MSKSSDAFKSVFGVSVEKENYVMKHHSFSKTIAGKQYCSNCGLIAMSNDFSRWCIDKGCYADLHPQYSSTRRRLTKFI